MTFPDSFPAAGCLIGSRRDGDFAWLHHLPGIRTEPMDVRGWSRLIWSTTSAMAGEVTMGAQGFSYPFLFRLSGQPDHGLLLSFHGPLVETFLELTSAKPKVYCPAVDIPRLVEDLITARVYAMSAIHARVEGPGQSLRTMSFYGSDVGDSTVLTGLLPKLTPYRTNLRRKAGGNELLSIGSRGEASFNYHGKNSLDDVDQVLDFLRTHHYIDWSRRLAVSLRRASGWPHS
jgi:hypothetical protein